MDVRHIPFDHTSHQAEFHRPDIIKDPLYVITPIFNSPRFRTRWKHYKDFEKQVLDAGAHLILIECSFGHRSHVFIESVGPKHTIVHVQTCSEIWLKENLINLAMQRLPLDWKYVAWIDADIKFIRPDWVGETLHQLQRYHIVQMFSQAISLDIKYEIDQIFNGFMHTYITTGESPSLKKNSYGPCKDGGKGYWHPGFAWAARREAIDSLGGLIDWGILGGGDMYMAYALIGKLDQRQLPRSLGRSGIRWLIEWQRRAERFIKRNVGFVDGLICHFWHGNRGNRGYKDRGQILVSTQFDPEKDLKRDWQGLYQLTDRSHELRDDARQYFLQRNEDATE